MKKAILILTGMIFLLSSMSVKAQAPNDFFVGKWNVTVIGTPNGDAKMVVSLERKDGKLTGGLIIPEVAEPTKFTNVEEKENSVTVYFYAGGYDVYLTLVKKEDNKVEGSMMDMFDAKVERFKEEGTK